MPDNKIIDIENINVRDKLKLNCPDFIKQAGISQIDFGSLFLSPQGEEFVSQAQGIVNDAIDTVNGVPNYISEDALIAIQNTITFIITDLIQTVVGYCTGVLQTYISPEFPIGLAKDLVSATATKTQQKIKNPADLLDELTKTAEDRGEAIDKERSEELKNFLNEKLSGTLGKTTTEIKKIMDQIQPYSSEISKYLKFGPDYAMSQVEAIYKKYLLMGIAIVDEQLGNLNKEIDNYINIASNLASDNAALTINNLQEQKLKKVINETNKKKQQLTLKAVALINKTVMNLMAQLGG